MRKLLFAFAVFMPFFAQAGDLVWVDSQNITSYDYTYADPCDKVTLGVSGTKYSFTTCSGQEIVKDYMNAMLTSPRSEQCVKSENCYGNNCSRFYGVRQVTTRLLLIVKGNVIDSFKMKQDLGVCR